jgi:CheY-like chemotaxis protein
MNEQVKVLVADDDPDVVEQLTVLLKGEDCQVIAAASQQEAEEQLLNVRPDLAIVDLMMEHMDSGFVLCHHIKTLWPQVPVILLTAVTAATGLSFASSLAAAQSWVKADRILDKPVRPEQLKEEVRRLLGRCDTETRAGGHS